MGSLRIRLTLFFVGIFGTAFILVSALGYSFFIEKQQVDFDAALYNHAIDIASVLDKDYLNAARDGLPILTDPILTPPGTLKVLPFSLRRSHFVLRTTDGMVLARSSASPEFDIPLSPEELLEIKIRGVHLSNLPGSENYRVLSTLILKPPRPEMILQVSAPMTFLELNREKIRQFMFISLPLIFFLATAGGLLLANRALSPVGIICSTADQIQVGDLSSRLPITKTHDELQHLSKTINNMLDRIEATVQAHERFVADASHQLKTPLSILRGELDILQRKDRSPEEIQQFLKSASQEIDSLIRLVENLLILARIDSGRSSLVLETVRLDELALDTISKLSKLAREKNLRIKVNMAPEQTFETSGDPELLATLLQNLIENAIKYTPSQGLIEFGLSTTRDGTLHVTIDDSGPGVHESERESIFKRFYRAPSSTQTTKGFGLGLSIAKTIAEVHHGKLRAEHSPLGGARFRLSL